MVTKRKKPEEKLKMGAPAWVYTQEVADEICEKVATTTDGLDTMLRKHAHLPGKDTIRKWRFQYPNFSAQYRDAKRLQAELMAEDIIQISDDGLNDTYVDAKGNTVTDQDVIQRSKLRVDARKWVAARLLPKIYGDNYKEEKNQADEFLNKINELMESKLASNKREY